MQQPDKMPSSTPGRYSGVIAILAGVSTAALIYLHPEQLRVPGWVAYSACAAFVLAGLALMAQASSPAYRWLVVVLLVAMLAPPLWAAFGTSSQTCAAALFGIVFIPSEFACRVVWGASSLLLFAILVLAVRWAMTRPDAD